MPGLSCRPSRAIVMLCAVSLAHLSGVETPATLWAQQRVCEPAERVLSHDLSLVTAMEVDSIRDPRSRTVRFGCRVMAAGAMTSWDVAREELFSGLERNGWIADPGYVADGPNGSTRAYWFEMTKCIVAFYYRFSYKTTLEERVNAQVEPASGEERYNVQMECVTGRADERPAGDTDFA